MSSSSSSSSSSTLTTQTSAVGRRHDQSQEDQLQLLDNLGIFKIQGQDKNGCNILCIIAKLFPARNVSDEVVKKYLAEKIYPELETQPFSILYVHTDVEREENFPGLSTLRSVKEDLPLGIIQNLQSVYVLHPSLQAKIFLATFGRFFFTSRFNGKLKYVNRVEQLWEHVTRRTSDQIELPEFIYNYELQNLHNYTNAASPHRAAYGAAPVVIQPLSLTPPIPSRTRRE